MELMRGLAFVALLFAGSAVGAELRQAEVCGDGTTHQAGYCPAVLSSASCSATGATTGSCSATSDEADGTRYVCATSNSTALTGAEIEACSGGAAIAVSSAAETGSNSVSLSGLTTDAAHYGQIVNESPEGWYSNRLVSSSFTPTASGGDPYDLTLGGTRTIPFSYSWPAEPVTTQTVNITANDGSGLLSAMQAGSRTINVPAGTYTATFQNLASDIDLVLDDNAVLVGSWNIRNISRVRITGGVLDGNGYSSTFYVSGGPTTDIMLNNVRMDEFYDVIPGFGTGTQRFAFVNSDCNSQRYCFLSQEFAGSDHQDIIIANSDLNAGVPSGEESTIRMMYVTRGIVVDNRLRNGGKHTFRVHYESDLIFFDRNQLDTGNGITLAGHPIGGGVLQCDRCWVTNNDLYDGGATFEGYQYNGGGINVLVFTGNDEYQDSAYPFPSISGSQGPSWDVSGNTDHGAASPPAWSGGADH